MSRGTDVSENTKWSETRREKSNEKSQSIYTVHWKEEVPAQLIQASVALSLILPMYGTNYVKIGAFNVGSGAHGAGVAGK